MSILFEPIEINGLQLKNRFVRSATHDFCSSEEGEITGETIELFSRLAEGGVGLIITGFASLLIGEAIFGQFSIFRLALSAIIGTIIYQSIVGIALRLGLAPTDLRLATGLMVIFALAFSKRTLPKWRR